MIIENSKTYGILYAGTKFPKEHRLEWLNYAFGRMTKDLSDKVKVLVRSINDKYSDKIIIQLDENLHPGLVCEPEVIEEIANIFYNGMCDIIKDLTGEENVYCVVWSIGDMPQKEHLLKSATIIQERPTLHHVNSYPVIVKVGHKLDSMKTGGLIKV